ncbi:MAG: glutamate racemase [Bradymonadia bacterium]
MPPSPQQPVGIFDSGIGGLTVLDAIRQILPHEDYIYLGDTARVPYGNRTPQTIIRYATSCARQLVARNVKTIVIACNTASAHAIDALRQTFDIPVLGVITPASQLATHTTHSGHIGVIGTRATIQSHSYERAIQTINPNTYVHSLPCPLFVPLVEEGWANSQVAQLVVQQYMEQLFNNTYEHADLIDTLILGCTHYPVLKPLIHDVLTSMHKHVALCDSGTATANQLKQQLFTSHLLNPQTSTGNANYLVTDDPELFTAIGKSFMKSPPDTATHIDIS